MSYGEVAQGEIAPPAELIPDLAPIESIIMGQFRGNLIIEQTKTIAPLPTPKEIMDYGACADAHTTLLSRHQAAEERFLEALGKPYGEVQEAHYGESKTLKRGHLLLERRPEADVVHKVEVDLGPTGRIRPISCPLVFNTFLLHKLTHGPESLEHVPSAVFFHGDYEGYFTIAKDNLACYAPVQSQIKPENFEDIRQSIIDHLAQKGRREALAPYAAQLAGRQDFSEEQKAVAAETLNEREAQPLFGLQTMDAGFKPIRQLLLQHMKDTEQALDVLDEAFMPDNFISFFRVLAQPLYTQQQELINYSAGKRFNWLTQKLTEMRVKANEGSRKSIIFGFAAAYEERARAEAVKTERLNALAKKYEAMENIGSFGPETWRSNL